MLTQEIPTSTIDHQPEALGTVNLLDVALSCARRGWLVFPCKPKSKKPAIREYYAASTLDEEQIAAWWKKWPEGNVGIACGESDLTVVDRDHGLPTREAAVAWVDYVNKAGRLPKTFTVITGRRFNSTDPTIPEWGVQMFYIGAREGSKKYIEDGKEVGDIQSCGDYVMSYGSEHPKSHELYEILFDVPLEQLPDAVKEMAPEKKELDPATSVDKATADRWQDWLYDYAERNKLELTGPERRVAEGWWLGVVCPWVDEHRTGAGKDDSTVLGILDGKVQFSCSHNSCREKRKRDALRKLMLELNHEDADEPGADIKVTIGPSVDESDFEKPDEGSKRPKYPDEVWNGTPYGEFADYCTKGNFIPKRFFSESLRTVVGAVVGAQLFTDYQGVNPRAFTVLIGPPGSGKGTAITAARSFMECDTESQRSTCEKPLLWADSNDPNNWWWQARYIGAHVVSPASAPGLIQATKPRKLAKFETRNPMELWRELPRFITIQEEIGGLFANFANENSGRGLETAILELNDRDSFTTTATNERSAKSGHLLYSVLGGIPKTEWDAIFARSSSVGSGMFSRLNIIGTENERTVAGLPEYYFGDMQRVFLPRITALELVPTRIPVSADGRGLLNEWFEKITNEMKTEDLPATRLNIHVLRVALHLAWLHGHAEILESDVDAGTKVADFQAKMREFYRPAEGETREAQWEARIMQVMRQKKSISGRELQKLCHAERAGTAVWTRAIAGLRADRRIAVVDEITKSGQKKSMIKLLKQKG